MSILKRCLTLVATLVVVGGSALGQQAAGDPAAAEFRNAFLQGELSWDDVLERARSEGEVVWAHWGGSDTLNTWIDTVVVPAMREYGITLRTRRVTDTRDAVDLVIADNAAGRGVGQGSIDAIWINGENFFTMSSMGLNFGSFADKLPNSQFFHFDPDNPASGPNLYDFGFPTNLEEVPWSGDQYLCFYDSERLPDPPRNFAELEAWLRDDPGRFTYVRPPQFTGNTFVQTVAYALHPDGPNYEDFQLRPDQLGLEEFMRITRPAFEYLQRIEPFLLGGGGRDGARGSPIYPENPIALEAHFTQGEIDLGCRFGRYNTATKVETGAFQESARNTVFPESGMIANKNFLVIPSNSPNPAAALVFANLMSSPENQLSKLEMVGYPLGVDADLLPEDAQALIDQVAPSLMGPTYDDLAAATVPDTNAALVDVIEAVWIDFIERRTGTFEEVVARVFPQD